MSTIRAQSDENEPPAPPRLLDHAPPERQALSPMRDSPDLASLHRRWAEIHAEELEDRPPAAGLRDKVARQLGAAGAGAPSAGQDADRALIGELIRAHDTMALRCDELSTRIEELESLLRDILIVVSEDLVAIRASATDPSTSGDA